MGLVSQFDILTIPEYAPPLHPNDPFFPSPLLINDEASLVSVYIPSYPSSQFWLSYNISPPYPPNALYYFKLFHNGASVVSWGCGEENGYRGKTMFGLFESEQSWYGEHGIEKRAFCFATEDGGASRMRSDNLGDVMEVRVYRSKGRRRTEPEMTPFKQSALNVDTSGGEQQQNSGGIINFANAGLVPHKHPRRYYSYSLLDPLDQPFATFRWYYRTWEELGSIGVISPEPSTATASLRTIEHTSTSAATEEEEASTQSAEALTFYNVIDTALALQSTSERATISTHNPTAHTGLPAPPRLLPPPLNPQPSPRPNPRLPRRAPPHPHPLLQQPVEPQAGSDSNSRPHRPSFPLRRTVAPTAQPGERRDANGD
ncbi:MAG: hypothetical protein FRX48_08367 [Lasallia pustulata]|uniref:Uncharacterized protein n=1 Tax=Lasallia pustulata TaxID=136370 RepID=A0A5M8PGJ7_9LECA|nr:MAG: hypothetical protein FRX48_08367 [Lasallia pustulata]